MTPTAIVHADLYTPDRIIQDGSLLIEGRRIAALGPSDKVQIPAGAETVDAAGLMIAPGLIDVHTHGLLGHDVMGPELHEAIQKYPRYGVTSFMATSYSAAPATVRSALGSMAEVLDDPPSGARCLGIHLEGPHFSATQPGAADPKWFQPLSWEEFEELQDAAQGRIGMITFAPEEGGALELIPRLREIGVIPAIGHSQATFEQLEQAVELGLDHATHTYNAMAGFHHRRPGTVGGVLHFDQIYAQVIADGEHVHRAGLKLLLRAKGVDRTVLISDSSPYAQEPEGSHRWHGRDVHVRDGRCELADGTLAGAYALLDSGLRTLVQDIGIAFHDALTTATATPADALALKSKGRLRPGLDADLILLNDDLEIEQTFVEGQRRYLK